MPLLTKHPIPRKQLPPRCRSIMLILLLAFLTGSAGLSEGDAQGESQPDLIEQELTFLPWSRNGLKTVRVAEGPRQLESIQLHPLARSRVVRYRGPRNLLVFAGAEKETANKASAEETRNALADPGAPPPKPVARARLDPSHRRSLVILVPSSVGSLPYQGIVLEDDRDNFPSGSFKFVNTTPGAIAGQSRKARFKIDPGESFILRPEGQTGENFPVQLARKTEGDWNVFLETVIPQNRQQRLLIFLFQRSPTSAPEMKTISEMLPSPVPSS